MSVCIFEGKDGQAIIYCSTTDWAFGPVMQSADVAGAFLRSLAVDARTLPDPEMERLYAEFVRVNVCECGDLRVTKCHMCETPSLYEPALAGTHLELEDDVTVECHKCELEPEPGSGERYVCSYCRGDNGYNPRIHNI